MKKEIACLSVAIALKGCGISQVAQPQLPVSEPVMPTIVVSTEEIQLPDYETRYITECQTRNMAGMVHDETTVSYSKEYDFNPGLLYGDVVYGRIYLDEMHETSEIAAVDLSEGTYRIFDKDNRFGNETVRYADDNYLFVEENNIYGGDVEYQLLDLTTNKRTTILKLSDVPALHYTNVCAVEEGFLIQYFNADNQSYSLSYYNMENGTMRKIDDNSAYPVNIENHWYYLQIDPEEHEISLIHYDPITEQKSVLLKTCREDYYISTLCGNGSDSLVFSINDQSINHVYCVNVYDNNCTYLFDVDWFASPHMSGTYLKWYGENVMDDRIRPMYHLFDVRQGIYYLNADGMILLDDDRIFLNRYKVEDKNIPKTMLCNDAYAEMLYVIDPVWNENSEENLQEETIEEIPSETVVTDKIPLDALYDDLSIYLEELGGDWAVYVEDLNEGLYISINNHPMPSASLIKIFTAGRYYETVANGEIIATPRAEQCVAAMISYSDNDAWVELETIIGNGSYQDGLESVSDFCGRYGYSMSGRLLSNGYGGYDNFTSVEDMGRALHNIYHNAFVNKNASENIFGYMAQQYNRSKIPSVVPGKGIIANKTGELTGIENDAAIVLADTNYILVIMSDGISGSANAINAIRYISSLTYQYLNP